MLSRVLQSDADTLRGGAPPAPPTAVPGRPAGALAQLAGALAQLAGALVVRVVVDKHVAARIIVCPISPVGLQ